MKQAKNRKFQEKATLLTLLFIASLFLDKIVATTINNVRSPMLSGIVTGFNENYFLIYAGMLGLTAVALLAARKKSRTGERTLEMASAILASMAVTYILKPLLHRLRPDGAAPISLLFGNIDYSFPSGHATSAAAAAFTAPALRIPWAIFTLLTIFARIYSSAHFLSDTVAGVIVAAAVAGLIKGKMKSRLTADDKLELRRQLVHAATGVGIAVFIINYPSYWQALLAIAALGLILSHAIKKAAKKKSALTAALSLVERKDALHRFPGKGAIMLFFGSGVTAAIFREQAAGAILILAIGDSVGPIAGRLLGRTSHKWLFALEKTVEGTVAGFVFAAAAAATILPVWSAAAAAGAGMAVEALHLRIGKLKIDDNLAVPVAAAAVLWALRLA